MLRTQHAVPRSATPATPQELLSEYTWSWTSSEVLGGHGFQAKPELLPCNLLRSLLARCQSCSVGCGVIGEDKLRTATGVLVPAWRGVNA
jgi:hypothetical protein